MPPRDFNEAAAGLLRLGDDPKLILHTPASATFNAGDELHSNTCPWS
jgi:hypothetical protein